MTTKIVICPTLDAYEQVRRVRQLGTIPVLRADSDPDRRGLPGTEIQSYDHWHRDADAVSVAELGAAPSDECRRCLLVNEPHCLAVGQTLCEMTGKQPFVLGENWIADVIHHANDAVTASLTLVAPGWHSRGVERGPTWLARIRHCMRESFPDNGRLSWGVLTAASASQLSWLAARSILQKKSAGAYVDAPCGLCVDDVNECAFPTLEWSANAGSLQIIDTASVADGANRRWSLVLRSANDCVGNQAAWKQLDTPLTVVHGSALHEWSPGTAGSDVMVIGQGLHLTRREHTLQTLWALLASDSLGEAVARLNYLGRSLHASGSYILVGDPDSICGPRRWPGLVVPAEAGAVEEDALGCHGKRLTVRKNTQAEIAFCRASLRNMPASRETERSAIYTESNHLAIKIVAAQMMRGWDGDEVCLALAGQDAVGGQVLVQCGPAQSLPAGLVEHAVAVQRRVSTWTSPLDRGAARLAEAAQTLIEVGAAETLHGPRLVQGSYAAMASLIAGAVAEWSAAHWACVDRVLELAPGGLWPFRLWSAFDFQAEEDDTPCPYCATTPTVRRIYRSYPTEQRGQWECMRCDLIQDYPLTSPRPELSFQVPNVLSADASAPARLEIDASRLDGAWFGAGAILVDGQGHGVVASRGRFDISIEPGQRFHATSKLTVDCASRVHLDRARAIVLLNGLWFLASRPVVRARS